MSLDRLIENIVEKQNPTVAGLDPKLAYIPHFIKETAFKKYGKTLEGAAEALLVYNKALIDALYDIVPAVKPQLAYYEMYGWQGVKTFAETVSYAKSKGMFVITDGKRNDIGTTMEAYANAHLGITDIDGDEVLRDSNDHYDEAIVPYDAAIAYNWNGYKGEHHLTDDVLSQHMSAIQDALGKNGRLLLVVDACHSGGMQRAKCEDKAPHRGTYDSFKLPLTGRPLSQNNVTETWITLSACKSFQTNYEVEVDGIRYGRLTYTISQVLCTGINAEKLEKEIKRVYKSLPMPARKHQTPELSAPSSLMHKTIFK